METISIEIINPKAKKILKNLADLNLISIEKKKNLKDLLKSLRRHSKDVPSIEAITQEVDEVRKNNYEKEAKNYN
jgi:precorrin-6B methylase 2